MVTTPPRMQIGSSPLARGKPPWLSFCVVVFRLIPARAGKTVGVKLAEYAHEAHPRSRGENREPREQGDPYSGSSPLARGKRRRTPGRPRPVRLIPARAGKTRSRRHPPGGSAAHPRSRGENVDRKHVNDAMRGSSPLARGKPFRRQEQSPSLRLIPARAGKTRRPGGANRLSRAHPRSRGENGSLTTRALQAYGSSPLARGKRALRPWHRSSPGLIPARAGKTKSLAIERT